MRRKRVTVPAKSKAQEDAGPTATVEVSRPALLLLPTVDVTLEPRSAFIRSSFLCVQALLTRLPIVRAARGAEPRPKGRSVPPPATHPGCQPTTS